MKVQPLNYTRPYLNNTNLNSKNNKQSKANPNFGNWLVAYSNMLENSGFIGEFISVDATGMMGPRMIQGYLRNHKKLGHLNYKAGREETVREFLSGPAYYYVPVTVLAVSALLFGRSAKVNTEVLKNFKKVMTKTSPDINNTASIKQNFVKQIVKEAFNGFDKAKDKIQDFENLMIETVESHKSPSGLKEWFNSLFTKKTNQKNINNVIKEADSLVTYINKANGKNLDNASIININGKGYKTKSVVKDVSNYLDDFTRKAAKSTDSNEMFIENFHKKALNLKNASNVTALSALSAFLVIVPKLYKTGDKFPGLEGLEGQQDSAELDPKTCERRA